MTRDPHAVSREPRSPEVPDFRLEQFQLDELEARARADLVARMASDADLGVRLADLARSDDAAWRELDARAFARQVVQRASRHARQARARQGVFLASVAAVLIGVVWAGPWGARRTADGAGADGGSDARVKGAEASLEIYRRTSAGSERLTDGDPAKAGDTVRIGYRVSAPLYGVIVSVDGRGVVTQHLPAAGTQAVALTPGDTVLLDQAFELDDAPRWEQFHLVTSPTPFDIPPVVRALAAGAAPSLPSTLTRTVLSVVKESHP